MRCHDCLVIYPTSGIATISPTTGTTTTVTKTGDGELTLTATVTACGESQAFHKSITFGLPATPIGLDIIDPIGYPEMLCPNSNHKLDASFAFSYPEYHWFLPDGWSSPNWGSGSNVFISTTPLIQINTGSYQMSSQILVRGKNECGYGSPLVLNTSTENCGFLMEYSIYPNPASSGITIEAKHIEKVAKPTDTKYSITELTIYDQMGIPKLNQKFTAGNKKIQLNVAAHHSGLYYIEISNGNGKVRKPIRIQK